MATKSIQSSLTLQFITLADYIITAEDKKMSVIGMFDKVFVRELPAVHRQMWLAVGLVGKSGEQKMLSLRVLAPSGSEEVKTELQFTIGDNGKSTLTVNFDGFPIKETGIFTIQLMDGTSVVGGTTFEAIKVQEQPASAKVKN
ncbi:MAG TPA: hypothetical protein VLH19_00050 [Patescibacteria group bacterium]|nr:hypothetical protein [Patescibacteria group bacterium]